ncbi:MAG: UDP-2,3-diacylglucosamine diphosphatase [Polaromonas sp.]|nr:UDP-2,3-diacylglucosamine diphosphatase [Polaromonas sp.]
MKTGNQNPRTSGRGAVKSPLSTTPPLAELAAPPAWRTVDFIADLHLNAGEPATVAAWQHYLQTTPADAVFMLGDLFEVWVGDDALDGTASFERHCAEILRQAADRLALFFMPGNRDFLVGQHLMAHCRATLLADPTVLTFDGQRWLLSHGDALCLDDVDYLKFRQQVRSPGWQSAFLTKPLAERQAIARHIREQSQLHQQGGQNGQSGPDGGPYYADVDNAAARHWLQAAGAASLIHGHTHRPATHDLGDGLTRIVLSDWDAQARPPRADALRLSASGLQRITLLPA